MKEGVRATSPVSAAEEPIVFVIDDDPLMLGGLSTLFRSIGMRVEAFTSATEWLQRPLPAVPSCLVLDIRLPRLSGFDLQAELNRLGIKIPIIFITGHGDVPMSVKAMKAGAIDFLTKPVREQEVLDAALIGAVQTVEHYEIARYGTLIAWLRQLGRDGCASVLEMNLQEEKAADQKLTELAESKINAGAVFSA